MRLLLIPDRRAVGNFQVSASAPPQIASGPFDRKLAAILAADVVGYSR